MRASSLVLRGRRRDERNNTSTDRSIFSFVLGFFFRSACHCALASIGAASGIRRDREWHAFFVAGVLEGICQRWDLADIPPLAFAAASVYRFLREFDFSIRITLHHMSKPLLEVHDAKLSSL